MEFNENVNYHCKGETTIPERLNRNRRELDYIFRTIYSAVLSSEVAEYCVVFCYVLGKFFPGRSRDKYC